MLTQSRPIDTDLILEVQDGASVINASLNPIRILAVDDHAIFRQGIVGFLADQDDLQLVADKPPKDFMKTLSPMGMISDAKDIAEVVVYLTEAGYVTGEVLHVDGGAHNGRW